MHSGRIARPIAVALCEQQDFGLVVQKVGRCRPRARINSRALSRCGLMVLSPPGASAAAHPDAPLVRFRESHEKDDSRGHSAHSGSV